MKKILTGCLSIIIVLIIFLVLALGYFGLIPGISNLFGSNKPRDLGIKYTETDRVSARGKSKIEYGVLPEGTLTNGGFETVGGRAIATEFSSAEITALMNNRPWKYYPYKDVQVKFNADGSAEISGIFLKDRLTGYGIKIGAPKQAIDFAMKYLPTNTVFYLKMKAALTDNQVSVFEPQTFEIGRLPLPIGMFLSFNQNLVKKTYAVDATGMTSELSKVQNKRALIIGFINSRLSKITGFFAKKASFAENKLLFDGTLPEKELTVR